MNYTVSLVISIIFCLFLSSCSQDIEENDLTSPCAAVSIRSTDDSSQDVISDYRNASSNPCIKRSLEGNLLYADKTANSRS